MQRASSNSGMGSALGGGAAESALGAGAGNVLTKGTIMGSAAFFILSFTLYLGLLSQAEDNKPTNTLPVEVAAPGSESTQDDAANKPLVNLPEGMDLSTLTPKVKVDGPAGTTTQVSTDQGTMIITEDAIDVKPAAETTTEEAAPTDSAETAVEAAPATSTEATAETAPVEEAPAATKSTETKSE
ncbi:hypothetical protein GCM10007047_09270 [Cerasicoccus arenae]|uniref:Protein-export membrane protein SecG n=2 Tax=Cerasicoccus arenae TaxID=424488 RepID=A0A8J3GDG9_9BACT|nr:hypothetical protein GCM10007047_09270 [Cerasicoccus arenae]